MLFRQLFDKETSRYTYLIADEITKCVVLVVNKKLLTTEKTQKYFTLI